jgi:hypothetical protein
MQRRAYQGHLDADLLCCGHDAAGNDVTLHDASKDVDQDGLDLLVTGQDLEGLNHLGGLAKKGSQSQLYQAV